MYCVSSDMQNISLGDLSCFSVRAIKKGTGWLFRYLCVLPVMRDKKGLI